MISKTKRQSIAQFDYLCPGHVSFRLCGLGDSDGVRSTYLTVEEAEVIGRRLIAWAAYQRQRFNGEWLKQPGNTFLVRACPGVFPSEAEQDAAITRMLRRPRTVAVAFGEDA